MIVAWLLAGLVTGLALSRIAPLRRGVAAGLLALVVLLVASQASYALARNLKFSAVVFSRRSIFPGFATSPATTT